MTDEIERYFSRHARSFDRLYESTPLERMVNRLLRRAIYERYALTFEHAGEVTGRRVLDVGCGSGRYAVEFARRGAEVVGLDVSPQMLELARRHAAAAGVTGRCRFVHADFASFTDPAGFDISVAIGVFDYVSEPQSFLDGMASLTRARVLASFPAATWPRAPLRRLRYALRGLRVYFYDRPGVETLADAAGFTSHLLLPLSSGHFLVGYCA